MVTPITVSRESQSHPSRVRGLKYRQFIVSKNNQIVAPFTGAWIEICMCMEVAIVRLVAPFTGAWIEMISCCLMVVTICRRTLHGCVD